MLDHVCHLSLSACLLPAPCLHFAPHLQPMLSVSFQASLCCLTSSSACCSICCLLSLRCPEAAFAVHLLFFPFLSHLLPCLSPSSCQPVRHAPDPLLHSLKPALATSPALSVCDCYFTCCQASSSSLPAALKTSLAGRLTALMQLPFTTSHSCLSSATP